MHMPFEGTITLTPDTYMRVVKETCVSTANHGARELLIVNWHEGNIPSLAIAAESLHRDHGMSVLTVQACYVAEELYGHSCNGLTHGGEIEALAETITDRVTDVIAQFKTTYNAGGVELTPGQLLERLGFSSAHLATPVKDLSGGQKRRLQLLLVLLDEPTSGLDPESARDVRELVLRLRHEQRTVLVSTHNLDEVERMVADLGPSAAGDLRQRLQRYHGDNTDGAFRLWSEAWLAPGFEPMDANRRLPGIVVPVQAIAEHSGSHVAFVINNDKLERRSVVVGENNDQFIQITNGLTVGDRVAHRLHEAVDERGLEFGAGSGIDLRRLVQV